MQSEHGTDLALAPQLELAQSTKLLDPAKDLFDPSACIDRLGVPLVAGGPSANRGASRTTGVLSHMQAESALELGHHLPVHQLSSDIRVGRLCKAKDVVTVLEALTVRRRLDRRARLRS
jgi:hypothetical protein